MAIPVTGPPDSCIEHFHLYSLERRVARDGHFTTDMRIKLLRDLMSKQGHIDAALRYNDRRCRSAVASMADGGDRSGVAVSEAGSDGALASRATAAREGQNTGGREENVPERTTVNTQGPGTGVKWTRPYIYVIYRDVYIINTYAHHVF